jgi:hypothetical protein
VDRTPGKLPNTTSRLIAMAASMLGSNDAVLKAMKCSAADFLCYCDGSKEPAWQELERLVTLIVTQQQKLIEENRQLLARHRAGWKKDGERP